MKKINLGSIEKVLSVGEYKLNPKEKYVINVLEEIEFQKHIMLCTQITGFPPAYKNYHAWLFENGFSTETPNPTNAFVAKFYGVKPLWKTDYSQGIVVRNETDDDYYIIMECSNKNKGYKHTIVILTLGGCM